MKKTLIASALIALIGCNSSKDKKEAENSSNDNTTETTLVDKEELNQTVPYEDSILLLGKVDRDGLKMLFKNGSLQGMKSISQTLK